MDAETLDADFYRARAHFCHGLANAATAAKPVFARLYFLAGKYEERAAAAAAKAAGDPGDQSRQQPNRRVTGPSSPGG